MLSAQSDTESRQTSPEDISSSDSDEDYDSDQWNTESLQILLEDASSIDSDEGDESDSAQPNTKSRQIVQEDVSDGNVDEGSNSGGSRSVTTGGHKPTTLEQKGKQPEENRNMGQLSKLPKMPLNVLYEIFSLVHPMDLLSMSRTSKALRKVLKSKLSRPIWIAAFSNIPEARRPPPCPNVLTEIEYANLLYDRRCNICGSPHATMHWMALARLCKDCVIDTRWLPIDALFRSLGCLLIRGLPKGSYLFLTDMDELKKELETTSNKTAVIQRFEREVTERKEFGDALLRLEKMAEADREAPFVAACNRRIRQVLKRLANKGWGEEILSHKKKYIKSITEVNGVKSPQPLTKQAWEEMEGRVLDAMEARKKNIEAKTLNKS